MDAVQKAKSGHPGAPMGMADMMEVLWCDVLKHNPANPQWVDRDRFVLSNGHASMLLYGTLHLSGYALSIDDIKAFRQRPGIPSMATHRVSRRLPDRWGRDSPTPWVWLWPSVS
jgi:transketolase